MNQKLFAVAMVFATAAWPQSSPTIEQKAVTSACSNIVALAGNVSINCSSLTPSQVKMIEAVPAVLNKLLANQLDPALVMEKLDEIQRSLKTVPRIRDINVEQFRNTLRYYNGVPVEVQIIADRLSPFVMKVKSVFGDVDLLESENGEYGDSLTIEFGDQAQQFAQMLQAIFKAFGIAASTKANPPRIEVNRIRIKIATGM